jgi:hypothetical protein
MKTIYFYIRIFVLTDILAAEASAQATFPSRRSMPLKSGKINPAAATANRRIKSVTC